jgi:hypothetical protein
MRAKPLLAVSGAILAAGFLFGVGLRASQWLVPAPPEQLELCAPEGPGGEGESCVLVDAAADVPAALLEKVQPDIAPSPLQTI